MITFLQDRDGWACLEGSTALGRIDETGGAYVLTLVGRAPETFADIDGAQAKAMDIHQPDWRRVDAEVRAARQEARDAQGVAKASAEATRNLAQARRPRRRSPWKGGPKQGTKYARAVSICEHIFSHGRSTNLERLDKRGRSEAHANAYKLAREAASMLGDAQGMSGIPACRLTVSSLRAKAARLLAKAEALMPEVHRIDRQAMSVILDKLESLDDAES